MVDRELKKPGVLLTSRPFTTEERQELWDEICERTLMKEPLMKICKLEGMPEYTVVYDWMKRYPDLKKQFAEARSLRAFARGDHIDSIIELVLAKVIDANSARVIIDAEKWQMSHERPTDFGDRVAIEHDVTGTLADAVHAARRRVLTEPQTQNVIDAKVEETSDGADG